MTDDDDSIYYTQRTMGIALMSVAAATWLTIVSFMHSVYAEFKWDVRINNVNKSMSCANDGRMWHRFYVMFPYTFSEQQKYSNALNW